MLRDDEKRMLYFIAREYYAGVGNVLDLGAYLGGSTACLAAGLRDQGVTSKVLHSYDLFRLGAYEIQRDFPEGSPWEQNSRPIFDANISQYADLVVVHEGDLLNQTWPDHAPIELLFVDIAKSYKTWDHIVQQFFPALLAGRSLVILQDYLFAEAGPWHHVVMELLGDYFEYLFDMGRNSAVFLNTAAIPSEALEAAAWMNIDDATKLNLMRKAIDRMDTEEKREILRGPLELLIDGKDTYWGMKYHTLA